MKKELKEFGEQRGYVEEVGADFYIVMLDHPKGLRPYKFPKSFSAGPLQVNDSIRFYIADVNGTMETRLEKLPTENIDLDKLEVEFIARLERRIKRERRKSKRYGEM